LEIANHCCPSKRDAIGDIIARPFNRKTGNRLKQQNVDSETGEVVSRDEMVRGYEVAKGQLPGVSQGVDLRSI
jgi:non-homologous end joining protein Ku